MAEDEERRDAVEAGETPEPREAEPERTEAADAGPEESEPEESEAAETEPRRRPRITRRVVIVLGLVAAGIALLGVTRTWITVPPPASNVQLEALAVSGTDAAGAVLALAVVAVAAALAGTIAARIARPIVAVLQAIVGVGIVGFTVSVLADPQTAAQSSVSTQFGVQTVSGADYSVSAWPWVSIVGGVLVVVAAALLLVAGRHAPTSHRYERTRSGRAVVTAQTMDDIDRWDAFTQGEDPTEGEGGRPGARFH